MYEFVTIVGIGLFLLGAWYQAVTFGWQNDAKMDERSDALIVAGLFIVFIGFMLLILQ